MTTLTTETSVDSGELFFRIRLSPRQASRIPELSATTDNFRFDGDYRGLFCVGVSLR